MLRSAVPIDSGHTCYTPLVLRVYDAWVLGVSNRWLWRCPTSRLLKHYDQHVTANHLDVGVGTGYFLDRCRFPAQPRLALLDANPHALARTSKRIARYCPEVYARDLLSDFAWDAPLFDSIGFNYVWHCLPGDREAKAMVVQRLAALLRPGGVLFGSTLLACDPRGSRGARWLMSYYNSHGIFANAGDTEESLRAALESSFTNVSIERIGCAAVFAGRLPAVQRA